MKGYKGMDANMRCRGMQYEIGKSYHIDGEIKICENGLHFCKMLIDVFDFYARDGKNRFFEVEASGKINTQTRKSVSSDLKIIRELARTEINRAAYGNGNGYGYYGTGDGTGDGDGYGTGYGYGTGDGNGTGYGTGDGYGEGYGGYSDDYGGYGDGYVGYGDGYGYGYGDRYRIKNMQKILLLV